MIRNWGGGEGAEKGKEEGSGRGKEVGRICAVRKMREEGFERLGKVGKRGEGRGGSGEDSAR